MTSKDELFASHTYVKQNLYSWVVALVEVSGLNGALCGSQQL